MARRPSWWLLSAWLCASFAAVIVADTPASWTGDFAPISSSDWTYDRAAHLLERAGFGGTPADVARLAASDAAARRGLAGGLRSAWETPRRPVRRIGRVGSRHGPVSDEHDAEAVRIGRERGEALGVKILPQGSQRRLQPVVDKFFYGLRANTIETQRLGVWWATRMLTTPRPLEEKLTLFWHGHFASRRQRQGPRLPDDAAGRTRCCGPAPRDGCATCWSGFSKDPAMLVYLDNGENVKCAPERELRPRAARALHDGRGQLHRARRAWRPRAPLPAGPTTSSPSNSTPISTISATRRSSATPARSMARTSSIPSSRSRSRRVRRRQDLPLLRARRGVAGSARRSRPQVPRQRLPDQTAVEAVFLSKDFYSSGSWPRRSRALSSWSCPPTRRWGCASCRRFPTSAA